MPAIPEHQSVDSAGTPTARPALASGNPPAESFGDMPVETEPHTSGAHPAVRGDDGSDRLSIRTSPVIDLTDAKPTPPTGHT